MGYSSWNALLLPVLIIPLFIFTLALGYLMSLFNAILRDIGAVLPLVLSFLMFATPVLYPPTKDGFYFTYLNLINVSLYCKY